MAHADAVDEVEVREWDNSDRVEVLDEGEAITETAIVDLIAKATNGFGEAILLNLAVEELLNVVDVETGR